MPQTKKTFDRSLGRIEVLIFACALSMITYLDRACFGAAAPYMVRDLGLKDIGDLKWTFTAFAFAYAAFEMPSGWLGDAFGPRRTLIRIVIGWSIFTALTGLVGIRVGTFTFGGLGLLCLIRFLFGVGEAGAYPNLARVVANWFPAEERGRAKGWIWMSGRFMGGATPLIWTLLVAGTAYTSPLISWRGAFLSFGVIGLVWCLLFWWRFTDHPTLLTDDASPSKPFKQANDADSSALSSLAVHGFPLRMLLTSRTAWLLGLMYFCASFSWYFNITYFPSFLETSYGVSPTSIAGSILKGGPLLLGGLGCLIGGYWTDYLTRRFIRKGWARRLPAMVGHGLCGACYVAALFADSAWTAALAISLAAFSNDLMMGAAWSTCQDVGRKHTAVIAGWMNMVGNMGGAVSAWTVGSILEWMVATKAVADQVDVKMLSDSAKRAALSQGYEYGLMSFVFFSFLAVVAWLGIDSERTME